MNRDYRVDMHPGTQSDLDQIEEMLIELIGPRGATERIAEIERDVIKLSDLPKKGSLRPGNLRAIPVGRNAVATFRVDDATRTVLVLSVTWGGADWSRRTRQR